jgi:hypothetical protein
MVDLLAYLATKFSDVRMVIVTYRQSELRLAKRPFLFLKLDLAGRGLPGD